MFARSSNRSPTRFISKYIQRLRAKTERSQSESRKSARRLLLGPERLEDRRVLATITWTNAAGGDWNLAANWDLNRLPAAIDDVGAEGLQVRIGVIQAVSHV